MFLITSFSVDILPELRREFVFRKRIRTLASKMMKQIRAGQSDKNLIFVGIHARRGDRIRKWQERKMFKKSKIRVGNYEGKFFNRAMDIFRSKFNNEEQKVIFLPTSDDYFWIKKHLINKNDTFYSRELIKETRVAPPNNNEISQIWHDKQLAIKGLRI